MGEGQGGRIQMGSMEEHKTTYWSRSCPGRIPMQDREKRVKTNKGAAGMDVCLCRRFPSLPVNTGNGYAQPLRGAPIARQWCLG